MIQYLTFNFTKKYTSNIISMHMQACVRIFYQKKKGKVKLLILLSYIVDYYHLQTLSPLICQKKGRNSGRRLPFLNKLTFPYFFLPSGLTFKPNSKHYIVTHYSLISKPPIRGTILPMTYD